MSKCAVCGKETGEASGVSIELMRGSVEWCQYIAWLCPEHREAVYAAAKAGARSEIEKAKTKEATPNDID